MGGWGHQLIKVFFAVLPKTLTLKYFFFLGGGSLVALAVAEDEKPPASIALDDKTFKEKVLAFQIEPFKMVKFIQFI